MTSPTCSGTMPEMYSMSAGILKIIRPVLESCSFSPPMVRLMARACGSGISSLLTTHGPIGANVGKLLPRDHCVVARWTSRALTSFMRV